MKLGLVLEVAPGAGELERLAVLAAEAEAAGLALGWLAPAGDAALHAAAALAPRTSVLRLAAQVRVGAHPLEIAESAAVADSCANGRLTLVLDAADDPDALGETADAVLAALAPRPFRHEGARWRIPANLPEHEPHEQRIAVRPPTVQDELPVWLSGRGAPEQARLRGLAHVVGPDDDPVAHWAATEARLGAAAARLRRPALLDVPAPLDADALVARLRADQRGWGLDTAVLRLAPALADDERARAIRTLATHVAPRVAMHELPPGLEAHWQATLPR